MPIVSFVSPKTGELKTAVIETPWLTPEEYNPSASYVTEKVDPSSDIDETGYVDLKELYARCMRFGKTVEELVYDEDEAMEADYEPASDLADLASEAFNRVEVEKPEASPKNEDATKTGANVEQLSTSEGASEPLNSEQSD